jgi:cell division septation protein DedD
LRKQEMPEFSYAARRGRPVVDPAIRRMAFGAGGVSLLVIAVALVWGGMKPGIGFGPPPVIAAPPGPLRVQPADPGGLTVPEADEQIMSGAASAPPQLGDDGTAPALTQLNADAEQAAPRPAPAAARAPALAAVPGVTVPAGNVQVQLAAAPDEADVENVWSLVSQGAQDVLGGRQPEIVPAVENGNSVWLLRLGGFADQDAARAFCAALAAKGAACSVAGP